MHPGSIGQRTFKFCEGRRVGTRHGESFRPWVSPCLIEFLGNRITVSDLHDRFFFLTPVVVGIILD